MTDQEKQTNWTDARRRCKTSL